VHSLYFVFFDGNRLLSCCEMTLCDELKLCHGVNPYLGFGVARHRDGRHYYTDLGPIDQILLGYFSVFESASEKSVFISTILG